MAMRYYLKRALIEDYIGVLIKSGFNKTSDDLLVNFQKKTYITIRDRGIRGYECNKKWIK